MVTPLARGRLLRLAASAPWATVEDIAGPQGGMLVVSPHPDDESLAMGSLLASIRAAGRPVVLALLTDGGGSHSSPRLGRSGLVRLRQRELREALRRLGGAEEIIALGHPDQMAPQEPTSSEIAQLSRAVTAHGITRVLTCWRGDPHVDHHAGSLWTERLCHALALPPAAEAPVWGRFTDTPPAPGQHLVRFERKELLAVKRQAISAHRSQMTALIPDDPEGFVMSSDTRAHFSEHPELYLLRAAP